MAIVFSRQVGMVVFGLVFFETHAVMFRPKFEESGGRFFDFVHFEMRQKLWEFAQFFLHLRWDKHGKKVDDQEKSSKKWRHDGQK